MPRLLLALLAIVPLNAQLLVDTYAGGVIRTGIPANNAALGTIDGIAWDNSGNIDFTDTTNNVIRRVSPNGTLTTIAGTGVTGFSGDGGPATSALINSPSILRTDTSGNLYFFDSGNLRIRRIDTNGIITTIAGDGQYFVAGLDTQGPATSRSIAVTDLAIDASGNVYVAEQSNNDISRVTAAGNLSVFAQVDNPQGLVVDPSGNVYVYSAVGAGSLLRISPSGTVSTFVSFPNGPNEATLISTDSAGNVYALVDAQLLCYTPDGTSTLLAMPAGLSSPLSIDPHGNIAFATNIPHGSSFPIIQTFTSQSILTTVAGASPQSAPDGTPLSQAWFLLPTSIAFSHTGDLYIAESGACAIRKISAAGVLSTFAGTGNCQNPVTANSVYPYTLAIDNQNNVWVIDYTFGLYSISQNGTRSTAIPAPVIGNHQQLAVDAQNRVYVLASLSLYRVLPDLSYQAIIPGSLGVNLSGLGADSVGNVYFSASIQPATTAYLSNTYVMNDDLTFTLKYPNFYPSSIAFDPSGNVWGAGGGQLTAFNSSGVPYLGLTPGFSGDGGPVQSAAMNTYPSTAFGPDGDLYFVDNGTRIRRMTGSGPMVPPVISQGGVVNAVSYTGGSVAPGELISIFGSNFGTSSLQVSSAQNNTVPPVIGRTRVWFNSGSFLVRGAITAITPNQINVFVPFGVEYASSVDVQVQVDNILSNPVTMPVVPTAPALSTPILNQDGTLNSTTNPAPRGTIVSFFGTGLGLMTPQLADGSLAISTPYSSPVTPQTMTIGGQPATILYMGDAPTLATGVFQINATIPTNINAGAVPVVVGSSNQVTVFVN